MIFILVISAAIQMVIDIVRSQASLGYVQLSQSRSPIVQYTLADFKYQYSSLPVVGSLCGETLKASLANKVYVYDGSEL